MRRHLPLVLVLLLTASGLLRSDEKEKDPLTQGANLPGTFHPYNVNEALATSAEPEEKPAKKVNYTTRGKFHCLISEYDLDPVVMLLAKGLEDNAALRELLQKLDGVVEKNAADRVRAFVVFFSDDLPNVITDDDKRTAAIKNLERLVEDAKLRHVVVALASKDDLKAFKPEDGLTAVLYRKLKVVACNRVPADKLDAADAPAVKAILDDVKTKLGAKR